MGFLARVVTAVEVTKDGSGVDSSVNPEQGHAHSFRIVIRQSPEAAVGIAVFGAYPWMHNEGSGLGYGKHFFFEYEFAASDHNIRSKVADEIESLRAVGRGSHQSWR